MPDAYEIAQDLFNQGWRVKLSRQDTTVDNATLYDYPISALYHFTTPSGEEFESYGFFEIAKRLGGKFYNDYSWAFCEKILEGLVALSKDNANKNPESLKLVVTGKLNAASTWVMNESFVTGVKWIDINEMGDFDKSMSGLTDWFDAAGRKKVKMTIEVLGEWEY